MAYGTRMVDASSTDMSSGTVHCKIGSAVTSATVGTNGAIPITFEPPDVRPEYSRGPSSYSTASFSVSMFVSDGLSPMYSTETFFTLKSENQLPAEASVRDRNTGFDDILNNVFSSNQIKVQL